MKHTLNILIILLLLVPSIGFAIAGFESIRQAAIQEYNERVLPSISTQITALGQSGRSSAHNALIAKAKQAHENNLALLKANYERLWAPIIQLQNKGALKKNQAEYDWLLAQVKNMIASAKKTHSQIQNTISSYTRGLNGSGLKPQPINTNDIKLNIVVFLTQVGTETAWILLNDLEQQNYLL